MPFNMLHQDLPKSDWPLTGAWLLWGVLIALCLVAVRPSFTFSFFPSLLIFIFYALIYLYYTNLGIVLISELLWFYFIWKTVQPRKKRWYKLMTDQKHKFKYRRSHLEVYLEFLDLCSTPQKPYFLQGHLNLSSTQFNRYVSELRTMGLLAEITVDPPDGRNRALYQVTEKGLTIRSQFKDLIRIFYKEIAYQSAQANMDLQNFRSYFLSQK